MARRRSIAAILRWGTAILAGTSAFVGAAIGLNDQVCKAWHAIIGDSDGGLGNYTLVEDWSSPANLAAVDDPANAIGDGYIVAPDPTRIRNPNDLEYNQKFYMMTTGSFTVTPPEGVKQPIMDVPCSCLIRNDQMQRSTLINTCSAEAKVSLMRYPHYPLENQPPQLPVRDDIEDRSDTTYAAVTLPPDYYLKVSYNALSLLDMQVTQCSSD